jgi:hypothetical protein
MVSQETLWDVPLRRVLVCGSRTWTDGARIGRRLAQLPPGVVIVTGGSVGADHLAAREAHALGLKVELHPADWIKHGSRAGFIRNVAMLDSGVQLVLAFWDGQSPGTKHTIREAGRRSIPVEVEIGV